MESSQTEACSLIPPQEKFRDAPEEEANLEPLNQRRRWSKTEITSVLCNIVLLAVLIPLCLREVVYSHCSSVPSVTNFREASNRATIGTLANEYQSLRFQFLSSDPIYSGPPSPVVDEAWAAITENKLMIVPEEDISQNTSSRHALRGSNAHSSGVLAKFEGFHALHCVNLLWRYTWPNYYTTEQDQLKQSPIASHIHLDHCADLLRQTLQCNMDFSIHTYYRSHNAVYGDFKTLHQCQNYDAILKYVDAHQWSEDYVQKLEGYEEIPAEDS